MEGGWGGHQTLKVLKFLIENILYTLKIEEDGGHANANYNTKSACKSGSPYLLKGHCIVLPVCIGPTKKNKNVYT